MRTKQAATARKANSAQRSSTKPSPEIALATGPQAIRSSSCNGADDADGIQSILDQLGFKSLEEALKALKENGRTLDLIRKKELAERLRVNRWTLMRWVRLGRFPAPIRLSDCVIAWRIVDVEVWLRQREQGAG